MLMGAVAVRDGHGSHRATRELMEVGSNCGQGSGSWGGSGLSAEKAREGARAGSTVCLSSGVLERKCGWFRLWL